MTATARDLRLLRLAEARGDLVAIRVLRARLYGSEPWVPGEPDYAVLRLPWMAGRAAAA